MREKAKLLREIQMCSFYLYELQLYLDTHPNCGNARKAYDQHRERQQRLMEMYAEHYGPLNPMQAGCGMTWDWTDQPWPWEGRDD